MSIFASLFAFLSDIRWLVQKDAICHVPANLTTCSCNTSLATINNMRQKTTTKLQKTIFLSYLLLFPVSLLTRLQANQSDRFTKNLFKSSIQKKIQNKMVELFNPPSSVRTCAVRNRQTGRYGEMLLLCSLWDVLFLVATCALLLHSDESVCSLS